MINLLIGFINKTFYINYILALWFSLMLLEIITKAIILHIKAMIFVSFNFAVDVVVVVVFPHIYLLTRQGFCE